MYVSNITMQQTTTSESCQRDNNTRAAKNLEADAELTMVQAEQYVRGRPPSVELSSSKKGVLPTKNAQNARTNEWYNFSD